MTNIFPIDFEEKLTMAQDDFILFSDSEDWNKIKKAQYKNLKWEQWDPWTPGADGQDWAAATITVWSVTTWAAWSSATVVNSWTSSAAVLDFTIPQGVAWTPWADWQDGADWAAATITIWTTTTLPAWSSATVTNVWTSSAAVLNFGIPKWDSGTWSGDVSWPASSTDWDVVIFDWSTWKLIKDGSVALSTLSAWAWLWATSIQPWDNISDLANDSWFITSSYHDSTKQDTLVSWTNIKTINWNSLLWSGNITIDESSFKVFTVTDLDDSAQCYEVYSRVRDGKPAAVIYGSRVFYYTGNYGRFWTTKYYFHTLYGYGETIFELILEANAQLYRWDEPTEVNLGWDVLVSDQPNNILTSWMKIWAGTEWDYANLSSYDNNTVYLTVEWWATQSSDQ